MKQRDMPEIPSEFPAPLGPISVVFCEEITSEKGESLLGQWDPVQRQIAIQAGMDPHVTLFTFLHERGHAMLDDYCVTLPEEKEEHVCDAIASALLFDVLHSVRWFEEKATGSVE